MQTAASQLCCPSSTVPALHSQFCCGLAVYSVTTISKRIVCFSSDFRSEPSAWISNIHCVLQQLFWELFNADTGTFSHSVHVRFVYSSCVHASRWLSRVLVRSSNVMFHQRWFVCVYWIVFPYLRAGEIFLPFRARSCRPDVGRVHTSTGVVVVVWTDLVESWRFPRFPP